MPEPPEPSIYQLRAALVGINPIIWRRFLVRGDSTIADLHLTLQTAYGWSDDHLPRFLIHGKQYGVAYLDGITFLSDGGDTVRELRLYLNPQAEHLLDWFHVCMRLTVMNQMTKGFGPEESESRAGALKQLESIKWRLWHGNVFKSLRQIDHLEADLEGEVITGESSEKLRVTLQEFQTYIENNQQ
jgi:Plasmid pRiA4b ORF-3-like protein